MRGVHSPDFSRFSAYSCRLVYHSFKAYHTPLFFYFFYVLSFFFLFCISRYFLPSFFFHVASFLIPVTTRKTKQKENAEIKELLRWEDEEG